MKSPYALARSPRVAAALILVLVALAIVGATGRPHLFRSPVFLVPVALFTISLGACTVGRIVDRFRAGSARRFGPDLIHVGLLVLICAGLLTALGRQELSFSMVPGDEAQIGGSRVLRLLALSVERYEDGSPRDWISTVGVMRGGSVEISSYPIRVNQPLRLPGLSVHQSSWATEGVLDLRDAGGKALRATTGQGFQHGDSLWYFADVEGLSAVFQQWKGKTLAGTSKVRPGDSLGPFTVRKVSARQVTGLTVVRDPGFPVVIPGLVLVAVGLAVTFLQGRREVAR